MLATKELLTMATITLTVKVNCGVMLDADDNTWVSVCPRLNVFSQGNTEEEAIEAIRSAVTLHLSTAFDHNRMDKVLRRAGFGKIEKATLPEVAAVAEEFVHVHIQPTTGYKSIHIEVPLTLLAAQGQIPEYASAR